MQKELTFEQFARAEIISGDLDPDYIFINRVCAALKWDDEAKGKWILLKTVVYNAESELRYLLGYEGFPTLTYGSERQKQKHQAGEFWAHLAEVVEDSPVKFFNKTLPRNAAEAMEKIKEIRGFGPWAAWKMIDLAACCLEVPFDFSGIDFRVAYQYPLRGMMLVAGLDEKQLALLRLETVYRKALKDITKQLGSARRLAAPPSYTRLINVQEVETILCKYHSYRHNHYKVGEDSKRLKERLAASKYPKIRKLLQFAP